MAATARRNSRMRAVRIAVRVRQALRRKAVTEANLGMGSICGSRCAETHPETTGPGYGSAPVGPRLVGAT